MMLNRFTSVIRPISLASTFLCIIVSISCVISPYVCTMNTAFSSSFVSDLLVCVRTHDAPYEVPSSFLGARLWPVSHPIERVRSCVRERVVFSCVRWSHNKLVWTLNIPKINRFSVLIFITLITLASLRSNNYYILSVLTHVWRN